MQVLLRKALESDLRLILSWRNNPEVYRGFYTQGYLKKGLLTWGEHLSWWHSRLSWKIWMVQVSDSRNLRDVGVVSMAQLDCWRPQIGIYIGEVTLWGQGIGRKALTLALDWLKMWQYYQVWTTILKDNTRAVAMFESAGFYRVGEGREGEWEYRKKLSANPSGN